MDAETSSENVSGISEDQYGPDDFAAEVISEVASLQVEQRPGVYSSPSPQQGAAVPVKPKRGWRFWEKSADTAPREKAPKTSERKPSVSKRRQSVAPTIEDAWSAIGGLAVRSGRHAPLGRCLQWQAPIAGEILDDAVRGTALDRIVFQPIAKGRGRFDAVGAIMGPPLIVLAMERDPSRIDILMPVLKASIRSSLPLMVPAIKKVQKREAEAAAAARELFPDLPEGADPVDAIISMMFADWTPPQPTYEAAEQVPSENVA